VVEGGSFCDPGNFRYQLINFCLQRLTVRCAVGIVGRLYCQITNTLQGSGNFFQRAFSGLSKGDTVIGVAGGNVQTTDLGSEPVGNRQAGSVVFGAVDAQT